MKRHWIHSIKSLIAVAVVASCSVAACFASDTGTFSASTSVTGYTPTESSTWGDLYRHFDPEGFEALSAEEQAMFDAALLDGTDLQAPPAQTDYDIVSTTAPLRSESGTTHENYTSANGYFYTSSDDPDRAVDIKGFLDLTLGVSSDENSIDYTAVLLSTMECPKMWINMSLYDNEAGQYVAFDSVIEEDTWICSIDDTFSGLESKTEYNVKAAGMVNPPDGYFSSGALFDEYDKETK